MRVSGGCEGVFSILRHAHVMPGASPGCGPQPHKSWTKNADVCGKTPPLGSLPGPLSVTGIHALALWLVTQLVECLQQMFERH